MSAKKLPVVAHTVITAHTNADFDALTAMIAASKLYHGAALVFPGSQEKNLRNFFIDSAFHFFGFMDVKDIDPDSVHTLVLCDTRQRSRLSHVKTLLDKPGVEIHAYDHHPDTDEDIPYSVGTVNNWGSTTSILVHEIRKKGLPLFGEEASYMALGIYEDTGSFSFNSTTPHDFTAAAFLKEQGADLTLVAEVLNREFTPEQISVLNTLLESAQTHTINGVDVVISQVTLQQYMGDLALLVHKMLDMENIRVLFVLGRMEDRIQVVARSRTPDVNVGRICSSLGGGGHSYAASASIKDRTMAQVRDDLFTLLFTHINPQRLVADHMTPNPTTVETDDSIAAAVEKMTRFSRKTVPVVEPQTRRCVGLLDHAIADKALNHELGGEPVEEYMQRDVQVVAPGSDLYPVIEIIMDQRQRMAPVVDDGQLVGVITRTDLINILIEEPARIPDSLLADRHKERSVRSMMRERLPKDMMQLLRTAGDLAHEMGYSVYAVGGFVRDILLRRNNLDLDLVIEGDGVEFARALSKKLDGRVRSHKKFRTAVIIYTENNPDQPDYGEEKRVDVATARLEYYEHPAALPTVELSSIKMDLYRRDFTMNALAVDLSADNFGKLVDFFGAQADIKDRIIRVLHSLSFVEDPTRILRALRFEQRFGFRIGGQTERLIKNAVKLHIMERLSGARLFHELELIAQEKSPPAVFRRMHHYGLLKEIDPVLALNPQKEQVLDEAEKVLHWHRLLYMDEQAEDWQVYLLALCGGAHGRDVHRLTQRLHFPKRRERDFFTMRTSMQHCRDQFMRWLKDPGKLSKLSQILEPVPVEGLLYLMAKRPNEEVRRHISLYLNKLQNVELEITGDDVVAMGVEPGPGVGRVLTKVRAAKMDGHATDRESELTLARAWAQSVQANPPAGKESKTRHN